MKKKTHDEYVQELAIKNPDIEVIGLYVNTNHKILHRCKRHNVLWEVKPSSVLKGSGCEYCRREKFNKSHTKTHEQYVLELYNKNLNIEPMESYIDARTPINHKCKTHNYTWNISPSNALRGYGCPICLSEKISAKNKKTNKKYIEQLFEVNPNIIPLEDYQGAEVNILHKCLLDGYEWKLRPGNALSGNGCPKCAGNLLRTHDEYVKILKQSNSNIEVLETYVNSRTKILHRCIIHDYAWNIAPDTIITGGVGCPICNCSHGEKVIKKYLDENQIDYIQQKKFDDCKDIKPLPFDFYLPFVNKAIEFDGEQHEHPIAHFGGQEGFEKTVKHDNIKNEYCKNNGISLLRIPYYKNIEEELNNFLFI